MHAEENVEGRTYASAAGDSVAIAVSFKDFFAPKKLTLTGAHASYTRTFAPDPARSALTLLAGYGVLLLLTNKKQEKTAATCSICACAHDIRSGVAVIERLETTTNK